MQCKARPPREPSLARRGGRGGVMEAFELKSVIEALIFVSEEPITKRQLFEVLAAAGVTEDQISEAIESIGNASNNEQSCGLQLSEVAGGYQFRTKESLAQWIQKLNVPKPMKLSQPALETLAIIAYRQPIVRSEMEQIRGVDVGAVLKTLLERNLIRIIGRKDEPGTPLIYGTTREFLETFNLKNLHELPTLTDIEELARRQVETQTPLTIIKSGDDNGASEMDDEEEEEEEDTEVIRHEEDEDEEALVKLEHGIKELRRLERDVFPKPPPQTTEAGNEPQAQEAAAATPDEEAGNAATDAPPENDSAGN